MAKIMQRRELTTDVLVVGNGGAGLRAAVEAADRGSRVVLASKLAPDRPNSTSVIGGWGTYRRSEEAEDYFHMVVEEGNYLNDQELAWIYAHEVVHRMPELRHFGVEMRLEICEQERAGAVRELWYFPGPKARLGDAIRKPLRQAAAERGVKILDNTFITRLLTSGSSVVGGTALDLITGDLLVIAAKAVILATGGASGLYARQNNPRGTTGDGYALAYNVGAELVDMEFDTFMMSPEQLYQLFSGNPDEGKILSSTGGAHYSCGGIKVDQLRCSTIDGLYAAGEAAGGTFGSARLGGSSVGDIVVSGYWAGRNAAESASQKDKISPEEEQIAQEENRLRRILSKDGLSPNTLRSEMRNIMWEKVGPVRREASLKDALEKLCKLRRRSEEMGAKNLKELRDAIEAEFMLDVAEVIAIAALERKESRGAHWRLDYPKPDNKEWLKNIIVCRGADGKPVVKAMPVSMTRITFPGPCKIGTRWTWGYIRN